MIAAFEHDLPAAGGTRQGLTVIEHFVTGCDHQQIAFRGHFRDFKSAQLGDVLDGELDEFMAAALAQQVTGEAVEVEDVE